MKDIEDATRTSVWFHIGGIARYLDAADARPQATSSLTPTERRIMQLIATGKTRKEIGAELSIHYRTVENHRTNICRKLDLEGQGANALLRYALQNKNIL